MTKPDNGHCPVLKSITAELDEFEDYLNYLLGEDCYAHDYCQVANKHYYMIESDRLSYIKRMILQRFEKVWEMHNP